MIFTNELTRSLFLQRPLIPSRSDSLDAAVAARKAEEKLCLTADRFTYTPYGEGEVKTDGDKVSLTGRVIRDRWTERQPPHGDYCNFGSMGFTVALNGEDTSRYNRISFTVTPRFRGGRALHMTVSAVNASKSPSSPLPASASHEVNLNNFRINRVTWEIPDLQRDSLKEIAFHFPLNGRDTSCAEYASYEVADIALERAEKTEKYMGWDIERDKIAISPVYLADGKKTAISMCKAPDFTLYKGKKPLLFKAPTVVENDLGVFYILDFSEITEYGSYKIEYAGAKSALFKIAADFDELKWKLLNFIYCERCGCPVPGKHGMCHSDITAEHNGIRMTYNGGWHDAGDLSQQTLQTGEIAAALAGSASGSDAVLAGRLTTESEWGLEFVLRTRFGDGFRATSAGATRWTQGFTGDMDDIYARVHNQAFQNYLLAAYEAACSVTEAAYDRAFAYRLREAAEEDFAFAEKRFDEYGVEKPIIFEHSYNSSLSLYHAAAALAAARIAAVRKARKLPAKEYRASAEAHLAYLISCQETMGEIRGYFCRDNTLTVPVHFNHQSREHLFAEAIVTALEVFEKSCCRAQWEAALRLYADYIKRIAAYTSPYGMLPAGVYYESEAEDRKSFEELNLFTDYEKNRDGLLSQIRHGVPLGDGRYLRRFPAWFVFRGNFAVCLSQAAAARRIAVYTADKELSQIADESVYWILGKNPFTRSFVYGEGTRYSTQYAPLLGETVGEIPVGIKTLGDSDVPYMPLTNNATYGEVWTSSAARLLLTLRKEGTF